MPARPIRAHGSGHSLVLATPYSPRI